MLKCGIPQKHVTDNKKYDVRNMSGIFYQYILFIIILGVSEK